MMKSANLAVATKLATLAKAALVGLSLATLAACGGGEGATVFTPLLTSTVVLGSGSIAGNDRDASGIVSFKGIPYAAPPVGELHRHGGLWHRWRRGLCPGG